MSHVIANLKSRSSRLADVLGPALGQGITNFTNQYYANKAIDKVLNDKNLSSKPTHERLAALERALSSHGEHGKAIFQNRLAVEQQKMNEEQEIARQMQQFHQQGFKERELFNKERNTNLNEEKLRLKEQQQRRLEEILGINTQPNQSVAQTQTQDPLNLSDEQIRAVASVSPQIANVLEKQKEFNQRQQLHKEELESRKLEAKIKRESNLSTPVLQKNSQVLASLPTKRVALKNMEEAINSGQTEGILPYIVDATGFEPFRNASSAQLKTAGKEYFLSNISRAGARPNQWIEQQIASAFPQIGRSKEGNLTSLELLKYQQDIEEKRALLINDLAEKYEKELGYVPGSIEREADKELLKYGETKEKELAYNLRKIYENAHPDSLKSTKPVAKGTPLTIEKAKYFIEKFGDRAEEVAKKLGYDIEIPEGVNF